MKRLSRKKRKIRFIREKNAIRKGWPIHTMTRISAELAHSCDTSEALMHIYDTAKKSAQRRWKIPFIVTETLIHERDNDYIFALYTVKITLKAA